LVIESLVIGAWVFGGDVVLFVAWLLSREAAHGRGALFVFRKLFVFIGAQEGFAVLS